MPGEAEVEHVDTVFWQTLMYLHSNSAAVRDGENQEFRCFKMRANLIVSDGEKTTDKRRQPLKCSHHISKQNRSRKVPELVRQAARAL